MRSRSKIFMISLLTVIILITGCAGNADEGRISFHYLGHASFILKFGNDHSVLTDYGKSNSYGLDSPIYDFGSFIPDIETYSHTSHSDHFTEQVLEGVKYILTDGKGLELDGFAIKAVRTSEATFDNKENSTYIFSYEGMTVVHLGDAQANIINIQNEENRKYLGEILPDRIDMLLMTIQGVTEFIERAEEFIDFIKPARIIPMHYWSVEYRDRFLDHLKTMNSLGRNYDIEIADGPAYVLDSNEFLAENIKVISLSAGKYIEK